MRACLCSTLLTIHAASSLRVGPALALPRPLCRSACRSTAMVLDDDDEQLDKLVREEVAAAFAGLEDLDPEDDEAIKQIQDQGKEVLTNVFSRLDSELDKELEQAAIRSSEQAEQNKEVLEGYNERLAGLKGRLADDRETVRDEMQRLQQLDAEYKARGPTPTEPLAPDGTCTRTRAHEARLPGALPRSSPHMELSFAGVAVGWCQPQPRQDRAGPLLARRNRRARLGGQPGAGSRRGARRRRPDARAQRGPGPRGAWVLPVPQKVVAALLSC